jgi:hypothetical protein
MCNAGSLVRRAALIILAVLLLFTSCHTKEQREAQALKEWQGKAGTQDYSAYAPMARTWSDEDIQKEPEPPPSTDPASDAKWTGHTITLPEGMRMQDAGASGREACILAYGSEGAIFVGTVGRSLKLKPVINSAPSPEGYAAVNAVIAGGKAYVFFDPGKYRPDKMPDIHEFSLENSLDAYPPADDSGALPQVSWWNAGEGEWVVVENLPGALERIYGNGGKDVILLCRNSAMAQAEIYAFRPGSGLRGLYSASKAIAVITNTIQNPPPDGVFSFNGEEAFYAVNSEGEYAKRKRHWHRWLGIIKPDGDWGLHIQLPELWSPIERETQVLNLPGHRYVFTDGGLCEYSESLNLIRRFRLPDEMGACAMQQQAKVLPIFGGLLVYEPGSRRITIMLQPELSE